jgi:hypothetical protein
MANEDMERLNRKVTEIGGKLDTLSVSVDKRFSDVDKRFNDVDKRFDTALAEISQHFVEQRQYTELAFDTLRTEMRAGFAAMRSGFDRIDQRLATFIETQGGINQSDDRRISALEHTPRRRKS